MLTTDLFVFRLRLWRISQRGSIGSFLAKVYVLHPMIRKRWKVAPAAPRALLAKFQGISPILAQILYNRGLQTPDDAHHFLYDKEINTDPFAYKDMEKAVARIRQAIKNREKIAVYGDFDADGVTSTTLMMQALKALKGDAIAYIPHRVDEGYGLNSPALYELASQGIKLVITVDCGIRSVQEVADGKAAGLDIVITDHHSVGPEIPEADAVVNPQQEDCNGDPHLAGVGVAFMVVRALLLDGWRRNGGGNFDASKGLIDQLLDLVAIGTVADIMPLNTALNRSLVRRGLEVLNTAQRPGIQALLEVAGVTPGQATAMSIGFALGPRINAAGRLDSALTAYKVLAASNLTEARKYADELQNLNSKRQTLTRDAQHRIQSYIEDSGLSTGNLLFAADAAVSPGIVGLVAGRLTEAYYRPAVILDKGDTESHASCRSIPEFHITHALDACAELLVRHGGHAQAAGFTILNENIDRLQSRLFEMAEAELAGRELLPELQIDMELSMSQLSMPLVEELSALEPTGNGNEQPVFLTRNVRVVDSRTVGGDDQHLKLRIVADNEPPIDCIGFRLGHWHEDMPEYLDVAYCLEVNEWHGRRNLQLNLKDVQPAEAAKA
ncbi:MAG: single-stranded-DNA-specific exonuclease RecJ [Anaerolineae bacterium]|nr:single-stranded-DNA-specific exonuclease RecJ [Anaerolineae bacterium]